MAVVGASRRGAAAVAAAAGEAAWACTSGRMVDHTATVSSADNTPNAIHADVACQPSATMPLAPLLREGDKALLEFLLDASRQHMAREDYAALVAAHGTADAAWPRWSLAQHLWRRLTGRSEIESELSAQREEAVERAERAELEVFDAVADATHAAHERDALIAEVAALRHEIERLEKAGLEVRSRLYISESCPLILPFHVAVDKAREALRENSGAGKIGTTCKGIGPSYEDKVARRALRVQDLKHPERFAAKLRDLLDMHNFMLQGYLKADALEFQPIFDQAMAMGEQLRPMMADVGYALHKAHLAGQNLLFEGAQGTLLDIDHGTYPYVTSSNCVAGNAAAGSGLGPQMLQYILGITKAYTTRVGSGPFPTELPMDEPGTVGYHLSTVGQERGTVTGRARRCGWLDAAALKRSVLINGVSGLCITKLDVLDGLSEIKMCVGYELNGERVDILPLDADEIASCKPIYETFPGWEGTTFGLTSWDALPANARAYLERVQAFIGAPIDMVSTGPDRDHTILLRHPYKG